MTADLLSPLYDSGEPGGDLFSGIENLSRHGSWPMYLCGDDAGNYLGGYLGDDLLIGRGGNDYLGGRCGQ